MKVVKPSLYFGTFLISLSFATCKGKNSIIVEKGYVGELDTIKLLTDNRAKFWDIIKNEKYPNNHTGKYLNWMFSSNMRLVEFVYKDQRRIQQVYDDNIKVGFLVFEVRKDTLIIKAPFNEKYLINKLDPDTLIVSRFGRFGIEKPIRFKKAQNQKEL